MENLLNDLASEIEILLKNYPNKKNNGFRFKMGKILSSFYINNKEELSIHANEIEDSIISFYKANNLDNKNINSNKLKGSAVWEQIKASISDWLSKRYSEDGYSITNLGYMLQFYRKYRNSPDSLEQAYQLDWSNIIELIKDKLNEDERRYYQKKAVNEKWSVKELKNQINDESYDGFLKTIEQSHYRYQIDKVTIRNYKSLVNITIDKPSNLLVFAGANATGKSSIFESIEFLMNSAMTKDSIAFDIFGGAEKIVNFCAQQNAKTTKESMAIRIDLSFKDSNQKHVTSFGLHYDILSRKLNKEFTYETPKTNIKAVCIN